jgi:hypothetical protein
MFNLGDRGLGTRTPEEEAEFNQTRNTSEFVKRVAQAKLDPAIRPSGDLVSGLFENNRWVFICSQHAEGRFANEEELKGNFRSVAQRQSKFGKSKSTYD